MNFRRRQTLFAIALSVCLALTMLARIPIFAAYQSGSDYCITHGCLVLNVVVVNTPASDMNPLPYHGVKGQVMYRGKPITGPLTVRPQMFAIKLGTGMLPSLSVIGRRGTSGADVSAGEEIAAEMPDTLTLPDTGARPHRQRFTMRINGLNTSGTYSLLLVASNEQNRLHATSLINVRGGRARVDEGSVHLSTMIAGRKGSAAGAVTGYELDFITTPPQLAKLDLSDTLTRKQSPKVLEAKITAQMSAGDHHLLFFKPGTKEVSAMTIKK